MPFISIITVCFNNLSELINTIISVDIQQSNNFEHIIIDGSTNKDISNYLAQKHQPPYRRWICEPDNGIADAFNKGIKTSKGEIILLLNAGDELYDDSVIRHVIETFEKNDISWLHGKYAYNRAGHMITIGKPFEKSKLYRGMRRVCHQTMYVKREIYDQYGCYDMEEPISMDYDFLCRIADEPFYFTDKILARYDAGGISEVKYFEALDAVKRIYLKYYKYNIFIDLWKLRQIFLFTLQHSKIGCFLFSIKKGLGLENF